jgi:DNA polymerase-1
MYVIGSPAFNFESCTKEYALDILSKMAILSVDTENLYNPVYKLLSFQIGNKQDQFLILEDFLSFKELLETKPIILQNGKHDLKSFAYLGIYPQYINDTFLQEMILISGNYSLGMSMTKCKLNALVKKYCGIEISKELQKTPEISQKFFDYALTDILYLEDINTAQQALLTKEGLDSLANKLENEYVKALAYCEQSGFYLDTKGFATKVLKDKEEYALLHKQMIQAINDEPKVNKYLSMKSDLFSEPEISLDINLGSSKQAIPFYKDLGFEWNNKGTPTIGIKYIKKDRKKHPILNLAIKLSECETRISSYGDNIFDILQQYPDHRLRSNFVQIINTGRMSSRGESDTDSFSGVNLQSVPKRGEERKYFIAEEGNRLVRGDFVGQETRILAEFAGDPTYLEFIINPEYDLHSFMAQALWPEYSHLSHLEFKEQYPDLRDRAKPGTFCLPYGGVGKTIAENCDVDVSVGEAAYNAFMAKFPQLEQYYKKVGALALHRGYILTNDVTKRKIYLSDFDKYKTLKRKHYLSKEDWAYCKIYESQKQRLARNYPIQSTAADMTKTASILVYKMLVKNNLLGVVLWPNIVHDEIVLECPIKYAPKIQKLLKDCMEKAGKLFCPNVPILADVTIQNAWKC